MSESSRLRIVAGMPAYNEGKYIGSLILQIQQYVDTVIVVDDGSTDHTSKVVELAGATLVKHGENKGYGNAIRSILAKAKEQNADVLVILDDLCGDGHLLVVLMGQSQSSSHFRKDRFHPLFLSLVPMRHDHDLVISKLVSICLICHGSFSF